MWPLRIKLQSPWPLPTAHVAVSSPHWQPSPTTAARLMGRCGDTVCTFCSVVQTLIEAFVGHPCFPIYTTQDLGLNMHRLITQNCSQCARYCFVSVMSLGSATPIQLGLSSPTRTRISSLQPARSPFQFWQSACFCPELSLENDLHRLH